MIGIKPRQSLWQTNCTFWTKQVPEAWDNTSFDGKLAWIMIITYTICILTLLEMLILR